MIMFVPLYFPSVIALDKYGSRVGITIGICLTTLGLGLESLINYSFWLVIAGQTFNAIGCPLIINATAKVSSDWFPENERAFATMTGASANILGNLTGYMLAIFAV